MACPSNVTKGSSSGSAVGVAPTIGIDLGTTYSCVAVWQREHGVQIIPNDQGHRITPSVVAFTDKERFVGNAALNQAEMNPTNTVFDVKRLIGKRYKGKVEEDARNWPFKVVDGGNDKPMVAVKYKGKPKLFAAEMISSMILAKMKHVAEMYLGQPVENAVVTVPAYFSDSQRKATRDAGIIAGLNVLRIINEPTAAALAYGYHKENSASKNVLVFDLGGGTFDVSLVNIKDRILDVKATKGDTHLGGEDFNDRMVSHFVAEFCRKYPSGTNIIDNPKALCRLRMKCEEAKQRLSSSTTTTIHIAALHNGIDFESSMTRAKFEDLNNALFQKCLKIVADCLSDAKIDKRDVGEVVLVGGSTRIPKVKELLKEFFSGREPRSLISPDEAVAYGAAVQAAMLQGITNKKAGDEKVIDMVLHDVTPLSLGVEVKGGLMEVVIRRNTPVPTTKEKRFTTSKDDHTDVGFTVFEGERSMTKNNNLLGEFTLHGIPPAPEGIPKLTVTFTIDADGILHAEAKDKGTGRRAEITISNDRGRLRTEELQKLIREADMYRKEDEKMRKKAEARNELESYAYKVRNALNAVIGKGVSGEERIVVDKALGKVFSWLERNPEPSVDASQRETTKLRDVWTPIIERVYDRQSRPRLAL